MHSNEVQIRLGGTFRAVSLVFVCVAAAGVRADDPIGGAFITDSAARSSGPGHPWQGGPNNVNPYSLNKCTRIPLVGWTSLGQTSIELSLYHNSYGPIVSGESGRKWSHTYDAYVLTSTDGQRAAVVWGDRTIQLFAKSGQAWLNLDGYRNTLRKVGQDFELTRKDQTRVLFGLRGTPSAQPRYRMFALVDRSQNQVQLDYDGLGRLARVADPSGRTLLFAYDNSLLTSVEMRIGTYSRLWSVRHDAGGRLTSIEWPDATTSQGPQESSLAFTYDSRSNVRSIVDQDGRGWNYAYQGDRLASEQAPGNDSSELQRYLALPGGQRRVVDPADRTTTYVYDGYSRLVRKTDGGGNATRATYADPDFRYGPNLTTSPTGETRGLDFDSRGNVVGVIDRDGDRYDYAYDSFNRLVRTLDPLITDAWGVVQTQRNRTDYQYDSNGNLVLVRRYKPGGWEDTRYQYDAFGQIVRKIDPAGNATLFAYDTQGCLVELRSPEGRAWRQLFETELVSLGFTSPNAIVDPLGRRTNLIYDERGRLTARAFPVDPPESYAYDAMDRLVRADNAAGPSSFLYGDNGWLEQETGRGGWVRTSHLPNGMVSHVQSVTPNTNVDTDYGYDYRNLVDRVSQGGGVAEFTYDAAGRLIRKALPNGAFSHYAYAASRLSSVVHVDRTGMPLSVYIYEYQADDRLAKTTEFDGSTTRYGYDSLGRLVREERRGPGAYMFEWSYDLAGNRVQQVRDGIPTVYQYDRDGLMRQSVSQPEGTTLYTYDGAGQLVARDSSQGCYQFLYDEAGRMTRILQLGDRGFAPAAEYQYDALGRRILRTAWRSDGSLDRTTETLNSLGTPVTEWTVSDGGSSATNHLWVHGLLGSRDAQGAWASWSAADGLQSVRGATDAQGLSCGWSNRFNAFGVELHRVGEPATYGFFGGLGMRSDGDAGLLFYNAVFYDSAVGCDPRPGEFGPIWPLDGDYSRDGVVDAADYIVWRSSNHTTVVQDPQQDPDEDDLYQDFFRNRKPFDPFEGVPPPTIFTTPPKVPDPTEYNPFDPKQREARRKAMTMKIPPPRQLSVAAGWKETKK